MSSLKASFLVGVDLNDNKAKVAWDDICLSKKEKGLGILKSKDWNKAIMAKHIWDIC